MKEQIQNCCKELRLSAALAENAMSMAGATNQEYLLNILKAEMRVLIALKHLMITVLIR